MFANYLKVAVRHLLKNRLTSIINIVGLAVGLAVSILILLFARNELTYDAFHHNASDIFLVYKERLTPTGTQVTQDTWVPMAPALLASYPAIKNSARILDDDEWIEYGNHRFEEEVIYADPAVLEIFTFPLEKGSLATVFSDLNSAVVSRQIAEKYFGDEEPIGKTITIGYETDYTVRGVLADIPQNSSLTIDILVPFESAPWYAEQQDNWRSSFIFTFVQLQSGDTRDELEAQFPRFVAKTWEPELNKSMNLKLMPLLEMYNDNTGAHQSAYILLGVAFIIVLIAAINFMNLTTARSLDRAREIGVRKVLGAIRGQLMKQYLSEALLMSSIALFAGLAIVELALPAFNNVYDLALATDYLKNPIWLLALVALTVFIGLISGAYPALVISRFEPVKTLKGEMKTSPASLRLRSGLVVTQFALAIVLIAGTGIMWQQLQFMKDANLRFNKENVIAIPVRQSDFADREQSGKRIETFKNEIRTHSNVLSVSSSTHVPGRWPGWFTFVYPTDRDDSQRLRMRQTFVDTNYFNTYDIHIISGRNFSHELATDAQESIIVNEAALRHFGWPDADRRQVRLGENLYTIVGVVVNYHYRSLAEKVAPVIHRYRPSESSSHRLISVKLGSGDFHDTLAFIQSKWRILDPKRALDFFFVGDNFARLYDNEDRLTTVTATFATLATIIACLGLFALASLMIAQRLKEIGIRKALGASTPSIVVMLTTSFTKLVALALLIATPFTYLVARQWLNDFAYRIDPNWSVFAFAGGTAIVTACATVLFQSTRAALSNPVDALKYE